MRKSIDQTTHSKILSATTSITDSLLSIFELMPQEDFVAIRDQFIEIKNLCENMIEELEVI